MRENQQFMALAQPNYGKPNSGFAPRLFKERKQNDKSSGSVSVKKPHPM